MALLTAVCGVRPGWLVSWCAAWIPPCPHLFLEGFMQSGFRLRLDDQRPEPAPSWKAKMDINASTGIYTRSTIVDRQRGTRQRNETAKTSWPKSHTTAFMPLYLCLTSPGPNNCE